jgi:hypothetical protein
MGATCQINPTALRRARTIKSPDRCLDVCNLSPTHLEFARKPQPNIAASGARHPRGRRPSAFSQKLVPTVKNHIKAPGLPFNVRKAQVISTCERGGFSQDESRDHIAQPGIIRPWSPTPELFLGRSPGSGRRQIRQALPVGFGPFGRRQAGKVQAARAPE